MRTLLLCILAWALAAVPAGCSIDQKNATIHKAQRSAPQLLRGPETLPTGTYLVFAYFRDPSPGPTLHLALSTDGYRFEPLFGGRPVFTSTREAWLRDPSIARGPGGTFHMVFTGGAADGIGYASSTDLMTWMGPRVLRVMANEPGTIACWAPEVAWDDAARHFVIAWSSEITGRYEGTKGQAKVNHRLYATTTRDFRTFAPARLLLDPGYTVLDPTFLRVEGAGGAGGGWRLFFKDERDNPSKKQLRMVRGPTPLGPWGEPSEALTVTRVEAPCAVRVGEDVLVYFDEYRWGRYGAIRSAAGDLESWSDVSGLMSLPKGARHGSIFRVPEEVGRKLMEASAAGGG